MKSISCVVLLVFVATFSTSAQHYYAPQVDDLPRIDGLDSDKAWEYAAWNDINISWWVEAGWRLKDDDWSGGDYGGRFKCVWAADTVYILAQIEDDILNDDILDPFENYWDEDLLEVFIDEDNSGGSHKEVQNAYNAFAYHLAINGVNAIDNNYKGGPAYDLGHMIDFTMVEKFPHVYIWEVALPVYTDAFSPTSNDNFTRELSAGETLGLSVAYCDDDGHGRENFFGSVAGAANTSSTSADRFGKLKLLGFLGSGVESCVNNGKVRVFPNPSAGMVNIHVDSPLSAQDRVIVYDVSGKVMVSKSLPEKITKLNLSYCREGTYILQIINARCVHRQQLILLH